MSSKQGNPSFSRGGARGRGGRATVRGRGGRGGRGGRSAGVPADYSNAVFDYDTPAAAAAAAAALATAVSAPASSDEAPKMSYSSQSSSRNITRNSSPFQFRPRQAPVPERCKAAALEDSTCGGPVASNSGNSSSIRTTSSDHHGLSTALLEPFVGQPVAEIAGSQHASSGRHQGIGMFRGNMMRSAAKFQSSSLSSSSSSSFQRGRSDGSLLRPVAFVKASTSLASTMTQNQDTAPNRSNAGSEAITTWNSPSYSASSTTAATNAATDVVAAPSLEDRAPNMQTSRQSTPHGQKSPDPACEVPSGTSDHLIEAELPARHSPSSPPLFTIDVTGYPLEAPPSRVAAPDAESLNTSMGSTSGVVSDLSDTEEVYAPSKIAVRRISQPPSSQSALRHPRHDASHEDSLSPFARERCSVRILEDVYCMPQTARRGQNITKVPHPVQQRDENLLQAEATIEHAPSEDTVTLDSEMSTLTAGLGIDHNIRPELSPSPTTPSFSTSPRAHQLHNSYPDEPFSAALEDYVSNVQVNTQTDQSTDSENDETLDLAFAKSFLRASTSEHLNSNDLADIAVLKKERTTARRRLQRESIRLGGNGSSQAGRRWPLRRSEEETSGLSSSGNEDLSGASSSEEDFEVADDVSSQSDPVIDLAYSPAFRVGKGSRLIEAELALDELDEHLQRQWEKDRAKKAIKRQERYLKLLEAHPTKANRKKAKRSGLTSDTYFSNASHDVSERPVFHRINEEIKIFIEDSNRNELHLPPMEKQKRYAIHMLAEAYNLKSKSRGSGEARFNVLYRTARSTLANANVKKIQRYLSMSASWPDRSGQSTRNAERSGGPNRHTHALRNNEGAVVGEGADRISADNIGHQLLAKMGWTIGQQIGRGAGGLDEPLSAIVKTSKAGLGSGYVRYNRGEASS